MNPAIQTLLQQMTQPVPVIAPPTQEQISVMIAKAMNNALPVVAGVIGQIDLFLENALSADDLAAFKEYRDKGAPGLKELVESGKLNPVAQLLWDEIKLSMK